MKDKSQLISGKAFQVFRAELAKHLNSFEQALSDGSISDQAQYKRFSASFHTIRGGAGFFGLDGIASYAQRLEDLFLDDKLSLTTALPEIKSAFEKLKLAAQDVTTEDKG